jgi:hypothetical protein
MEQKSFRNGDFSLATLCFIPEGVFTQLHLFFKFPSTVSCTLVSNRNLTVQTPIQLLPKFG